MIYLAAPYSHTNPATMHFRYKVMSEACAFFAKAGENVHSPIVHWHEVAKDHKLPTDCEWWRSINFDTFNRCDAMRVLTLPGWEDSKGVTMELEWGNTKPNFMVEYVSPCALSTYRHYSGKGLL